MTQISNPRNKSGQGRSRSGVPRAGNQMISSAQRTIALRRSSLAEGSKARASVRFLETRTVKHPIVRWLERW
jgi:hypothetical protein